jgi:pyruvate/2-oxoglutarate dehydrogenase complex dihydrolipoamide dehydrogenase (E3) component
MPAIQGLQEVPYYTYETLFDAKVLPKHLLVVGNGPIGVEMAQAFLRLGSQVTLFASDQRVVARIDHDVADELGAVFAAEGMQIKYNAKVTRARRDGDTIVLTARNEEVCGDVLLVATGRKPHIAALALDRAGVVHTKHGITVDEHLQTNQKHIYACGDCTGSFQFTHYAGWQGFQAVRNALLPGAVKGVRENVPWTIFTEPEAAQAGLTEEEARKQHDDVQVTKWPMAHVDRAQTEGDTAGFIKVIHTKKGKILGAHILAQSAGEMIHEYIMAMAQDIRLSDLASTIHVYPTFSMGTQQLAADYMIDQRLSGLSGAVLRRITHFEH